eukprot:TRINITY_DN2569_c0_g1_i2.p1 TRINITY_DN2569_c0_g1~~TRINITY_DN2569_c0_g1_i2.p1  ORF type:complete len:161 (+),score=23.39 TRINITY_DN2569_c0_g1_i2:193-675(+)
MGRCLSPYAQLSLLLHNLRSTSSLSLCSTLPCTRTQRSLVTLFDGIYDGAGCDGKRECGIGMSLSTEETSANQNYDMIDEQLKFTFKHQKAKKQVKEKKKKKPTRRRKTKKQIELLKKGVGTSEVLNQRKARALAAKAGLKVDQVHKWFWDYRNKQRYNA